MTAVIGVASAVAAVGWGVVASALVATLFGSRDDRRLVAAMALAAALTAALLAAQAWRCLA